jgi:hypothetical protein
MFIIKITSMKKLQLIFIAIVVLFVSCSKESYNRSESSNGGTGQGGSLARFTIVNNYLYVVESATLKTFDITNASNPVFKNSITIGSGIETIFPYKNNLFIGSQNGMFIYALNNPEVPQYSGSASHVRSCDPVVANDTIAFVTLRGGSGCGAVADGLYSYDVRNLLNPALLNILSLQTPYGLGLKNNTLFVCGGSNGLYVVNVSNPNSPQTIQTITGNNFRDVIPYNNLLICYLTDGIILYDISNIQFIKKISN